MIKRSLSFVLGMVLISLFIAWFALKGIAPFDVWLEENSMVALLLWGLAWVCGLGGAAIMALGITNKRIADFFRDDAK